jgi:hypothetical protein
VDFSFDGNRIVSCGMDHTVKIWAMDDSLQEAIQDSYKVRVGLQTPKALVLAYYRTSIGFQMNLMQEEFRQDFQSESSIFQSFPPIKSIMIMLTVSDFMVNSQENISRGFEFCTRKLYIIESLRG